MQEQTIFEVVKWFIGLTLILMLVSIGLFCYQLQTINTYKQEINYQIEREGGLTSVAIEKLSSDSKKNYNDIYKIQSAKLNQKVKYGEKVDYKVIATIPVAIMPIPDMIFVFEGSGVSQVR